MTELNFKPFDKKMLIEQLKIQFPNYKIQKGFGGDAISPLQVRTSGFTITGNVAVKTIPEKGFVKTQTPLDMVLPYWFFFPPIALYITLKRKKQRAMEEEVIEKLKKILEPVNT